MSEPLLTVVAEMTAQAGKEDALREALMALIAPTRAEAGCVDYILHESAERTGNFVFYENWVSAEALAQHLETPHLVNFKSLAPALLDGALRIVTLRKIA